MIDALQNVPVVGVLIALAMVAFTTLFNGWKERREGKAEGIRQERARQDAAAAEKDRAILERAENVEDLADTVRDRGDYNDDRVRDGGATLPPYHYRNGTASND